MKTTEKVDVREIRRKLGMNQSQFWSKIGVTQSGGSRYESGRNIPRPVQALLRLVHIEQVDISKIKKDDVEVVEYLKATNPELFKTLKKEARAKRKERVAHLAARGVVPSRADHYGQPFFLDAQGDLFELFAAHALQVPGLGLQ